MKRTDRLELVWLVEPACGKQQALAFAIHEIFKGDFIESSETYDLSVIDTEVTLEIYSDQILYMNSYLNKFFLKPPLQWI